MFPEEGTSQRLENSPVAETARLKEGEQMRELLLALAIIGLAVGWFGFLLTVETPGMKGAIILWFMAFVSMLYIIVDHIVPLMLFRGQEGRERAAVTAETVRLSGPFIASMKIALVPAFPRSFYATATLYPIGICLKLPFLAPYAVLLEDITSIKRQTRGRAQQMKLTHVSANVQSPLVLVTRQMEQANEFYEHLMKLGICASG